MYIFRDLILQLPYFVCLLSAFTLFCNRKRNSRSQNIWILCMLITAMLGYTNYFYIKGITDYSLYYKLDVLEMFCSVLFFPALYFYFRALTNEKAFGWKTYLVILPSLLYGIVVTSLYIMMGDEQATAYIREAVETGGHLQIHTALLYRIHYFLNTYGCIVFLFIQIVGVMIYATRQLYRFRNRLNDFFSNVEEKSIGHHWAVLKGLYILFICGLIIQFGGYALYVQYSPFVLFRFAFMAGVLYYICFHVHYAGYTAESLAGEIAQTDNELPADSCFSAETEPEPDLECDPLCGAGKGIQKNYSKILPDFVRIIEEDRIFLQKNLRLSDVAREIGTNRTYISQLLKEEYQCSFFDFINRKRIEYAMELVRIHPEFKQGQIAEECGFIHASVFSRAFKQYTGMTFREWQHKISVPEGRLSSYK